MPEAFSLLDDQTARIEAELKIRLQARFAGSPIEEFVHYQLESGGKRLRSASTLWIGDALEVSDAVLPIALAVELIHAVFLIHDDIEDGDTYRRGRPALWNKFGIADALNASDGIAAEVFQLATEVNSSPDVRLRLVSDLADVYRTTVHGQALDLSFRADPAFTLDRYDELVRKKTGQHLVVGWAGAARIAGLSDEDVRPVWRIGDALGPAFQIRDDLLDLTPGKGRGGHIGGDIREGKASILVARAIEDASIPMAERDEMLTILATPRSETTDRHVAWVIDRFEAWGAIAFAEAECRRRLDVGLEEIARLAWLPEPSRRALAEFAQHLIHRES